MEKTIAAISTPVGTGGISVIRISGADAYKIAARIFKPADNKKTIENAKGYTAIYGHFIENGVKYDEVIALCFRAPKSYTGEDIVEISCHGGNAVTKRILRACYSAGAGVAQAGEFTKRAFLNNRISLTQAEGILDMINATSNQGVRAAAELMDGALHKKITTIRENLTEIASHIAAFSDYPEEDVEILENEKLSNILENAKLEIDKLIKNYDTGKIMRRGISAAIIGSPNVGKSTLMNLMSGFERAIVTPVAGTTRDVVEQEINLGDITLILSDTAGIRNTDNEIEAEGIRRSKIQMENAALVIAVFDASNHIKDEDVTLAKECKNKTAIAVVNKSDLSNSFDISQINDCFSEVLSISARDDKFLPDITKTIAKVIGTSNYSDDAYLIANERQLECAKSAQLAINEAISAISQNFTLDAIGVCVDDALSALYGLTGENATENVINEVFSRFCVGK